VKEATQSGDKETTMPHTEESEEAAKKEDAQGLTEEKIDEDKLGSKDDPVPEDNPISQEEFTNKKKLPEEDSKKEGEAEDIKEEKVESKEESTNGKTTETSINESDNKPIPEENPISKEEVELKSAEESLMENSPADVPQPEELQAPLDKEDDVLQETPEKPKIPKYALLDKLLSLLEDEGEINSVLAGYFAKAFNAILERHMNDVLAYLLYYNVHIKNFLKHSYNKSIADVLNKLVSFDERSNGNTSEELLEGKKELLLYIVDKLGPNNSMDTITNSCYTLCTIADVKQRLEYFFSKKFLDKLFEYARSDNWMSLRGSLTLLIVLYRVKASSSVNEAPAFLGFAAPEESNDEELPDFTEVLNMSIEYLEFAKNYLLKENNNPKLPTASGNELTPFGLDRLKVIEWIQALIGLKEESVGSKLVELNMGTVLLELMKKYDMNSILHNKIFLTFKAALDLHIAIYTEAVTYSLIIVHH
jgi:serine/threonine-protein phosphatase 6 regulatory subunit 3